MALWALFGLLDSTKWISFILSKIVNVCSNIFAAALVKTDSIDLEIIEQFKEKKQQMGVNIGKHLNKMMWPQALHNNGAGFYVGIWSLLLVSKTTFWPYCMVCESYELKSPILHNTLDNVVIYIKAMLQSTKVSFATPLSTFYCYFAIDAQKSINFIVSIVENWRAFIVFTVHKDFLLFITNAAHL